MIEAIQQTVDAHTHKYAFSRNGKSVTYADAITLWQCDDEFRAEFISLLIDSPFMAYRWETPPITSDTLSRKFEFVLINCPGLARKPDRLTYAEHFANADHSGIVVFDNLGKDAVLVVPAPRSANSNYDQLAAFIRSAPETQKHALWRSVGRTVQSLVTDRPLWVSTAGGGVAWLHVRLDKRPKYYGYTPYKEVQ